MIYTRNLRDQGGQYVAADFVARVQEPRPSDTTQGLKANIYLKDGTLIGSSMTVMEIVNQIKERQR